jgi:hypothetical protein
MMPVAVVFFDRPMFFVVRLIIMPAVFVKMSVIGLVAIMAVVAGPMVIFAPVVVFTPAVVFAPVVKALVIPMASIAVSVFLLPVAFVMQVLGVFCNGKMGFLGFFLMPAFFAVGPGCRAERNNACRRQDADYHFFCFHGFASCVLDFD